MDKVQKHNSFNTMFVVLHLYAVSIFICRRYKATPERANRDV
jgi:hypothetical protein